MLIEETQEDILTEEALSFLFQLEIFEDIPGVGTLSGAVLNWLFMRRVEETARMVFEESGFTPREIRFDTSRPVGVFSRAADLTRARSALGWEPATSFREGLRLTIAWYRATHDPAEVGSRLTSLLTERA